jgi:hypothetical protein
MFLNISQLWEYWGFSIGHLSGRTAEYHSGGPPASNNQDKSLLPGQPGGFQDLPKKAGSKFLLIKAGPEVTKRFFLLN